MNHQEYTHSAQKQFLPRLIAWELTRRCNLRCIHCRAHATDSNYLNEFTTEECFKTLDNIASLAKPIIILTGGEPMYREDIYDIARYGNDLGLRMVMAPCGHLITPQTIQKIKNSGIERISLSIDGKDAQTHNNFRQ
ncbi:MAG: radical SAM protein, partial [Bacteroidales bacterium]